MHLFGLVPSNTFSVIAYLWRLYYQHLIFDHIILFKRFIQLILIVFLIRHVPEAKNAILNFSEPTFAQRYQIMILPGQFQNNIVEKVLIFENCVVRTVGLFGRK
jgi:hypothetical protein